MSAQPVNARPGAPPRVVDRASAEQLVAETLEVMRGLEAALEAETDRVRAGRLREAFANGEAKGALSAAYLRGGEAVKANAVALARHAPDGVERLRAASRRFNAVVATNQTVLATARSISEALLKGMSDELNRASMPRTYGGRAATPSHPYGGRGGAPRSEPLVLSRQL